MKKDSTQSIRDWNTRNLLTVAEIALWARVHPKTVYRWIKGGQIEAIQFGPRTFRIPEDAVERFLIKAGYGRIPSPYSQKGVGQT